MMNNKKYLHIVNILCILFVVGACDKGKSKNTDQSINEIVELIKKDAGKTSNSITNAVDLLQSESNNIVTSEPQDHESSDDENQELVTVITEMPYDSVEEDIIPVQSSYTKPNIDSKKKYQKKSNLWVVESGSYIKVGNDKPYGIVNSKNPQKITIALLMNKNYSNVDIYLYAIPINSKLIRNNNTLIGYIKNVEIINHQAQFTRYWLGYRSDGRPLPKKYYNIYAQYYYKNDHGKIIGMSGRYWGGSHRRWKIKVL